jgi:hypothetical protein
MTKKRTPQEKAVIEKLARVVEKNIQVTINDWFRRVETEPRLAIIPMDRHERCAYLFPLFNDLIARLREPLAPGTSAVLSGTATKHGLHRRELGYTAAMLVEESRLLQVSIFQMLHNNFSHLDHNTMLLGVMNIANEVDAQLAQQMSAYVAEPKVDEPPLAA